MKKSNIIIWVCVATVLVISGFAYLKVEKSLNNDVKSVETSEQDVAEQKAISAVKNLPEVKEWLALFSQPDGTSPKTGGKPVIKLDSVDGDIYTIHVYEDTDTHTATFNWYNFDAKSNKISNIFNDEDSAT